MAYEQTKPENPDDAPDSPRLAAYDAGDIVRHADGQTYGTVLGTEGDGSVLIGWFASFEKLAPNEVANVNPA